MKNRIFIKGRDGKVCGECVWYEYDDTEAFADGRCRNKDGIIFNSLISPMRSICILFSRHSNKLLKGVDSKQTPLTEG